VESWITKVNDGKGRQSLGLSRTPAVVHRSTAGFCYVRSSEDMSRCMGTASACAGVTDTKRSAESNWGAARKLDILPERLPVRCRGVRPETGPAGLFFRPGSRRQRAKACRRFLRSFCPGARRELPEHEGIRRASGRPQITTRHPTDDVAIREKSETQTGRGCTYHPPRAPNSAAGNFLHCAGCKRKQKQTHKRKRRLHSFSSASGTHVIRE
jgi:hypothetical protein